MRQGVSVILWVQCQWNDLNSSPKGIGDAASRQGMSYWIGNECSRPVRRDRRTAVECGLERHPIPKRLQMGCEWAGDGGSCLGLVVEDDAERAVCPVAPNRTRAGVAFCPGDDILSGVHQAARAMDVGTPGVSVAGVPFPHGASLSPWIPVGWLRPAFARWWPRCPDCAGQSSG